ncbi:MAG: FliH/SctL family protein [Demequina sp.]
MSPEPQPTTFVPASLAPARAEGSATARAAGYAAGWAAGARAAATSAEAQREREREDHERRESLRDAQVRSAVGALDAAIERWRTLAAPVLGEAEAILYQAAVELAEAVLARELRPGPDGVWCLLERALALPQGVQATVVRLSAEDMAHVDRALGSGAVTVPAGLTLTVDGGLGPGESITEHAAGLLDARIGHALARARAALEDEG